MLRLLAAPKLVADSAVAPGIRIRAQARLERSSVTSRTELLPALSLRRGRSLREMAEAPSAGPGVVGIRETSAANWREIKRLLVLP